MAKTLDFNRWTGPNFPIVMRDENKTRVRVSSPTEGLMEELEKKLPYLNQALEAGDASTIKAIYELAAKLISCNLDGLQVTAEDLRDVYKLNLEMLVAFYNAYLDFINEITSAKN